MKTIKDNVSFYQSSEDELKKEIAAAINEIILPSQSVDDISAEVADLREQTAARDGVILSIIEDLCRLLLLYLRGPVDISHVVPN